MARMRTILAALAALAPLAAGCQPPTDEQIAEMMKQPPRPAEHDRLDMWVGSWSGDAVAKMPGGKEMKGSGSSTVQWSTDNWILVENWQHTMGEHDLMKGVSLFWWDNNKKKYRMAWANNYGGHGEGSMKYDEATKTWNMKAEETHGKSGRESKGRGTVKMPDDNTMEWSYTALGLFGNKEFEVSGTSRKQ